MFFSFICVKPSFVKSSKFCSKQHPIVSQGPHRSSRGDPSSLSAADGASWADALENSTVETPAVADRIPTCNRKMMKIQEDIK